jgi:hypothetical protein
MASIVYVTYGAYSAQIEDYKVARQEFAWWELAKNFLLACQEVQVSQSNSYAMKCAERLYKWAHNITVGDDCTKYTSKTLSERRPLDR